MNGQTCTEPADFLSSCLADKKLQFLKQAGSFNQTYIFEQSVIPPTAKPADFHLFCHSI